MRVSKLLCLLIFIPFALLANDNLEQIKNESVNLLDTNPEKALELSLTGLQRAKEIDSNIAWAFHFNLGYLYKVHFRDDTKALIHLLSASDKCPATNKQKGHIINNIGRVLSKHSSYNLAIKYYSDGLKYADNNLKSRLLLNRGNAYKNSNKLLLALDDYLNAITFCEQTNSVSRKFKLYNQIGLIYSHTGNYTKARQQFYEIVNYKDLSNWHKYAGRAYHNIANTYQKEEKFDKAKQFFTKALTTKQKDSEKFITWMDYGNNEFLQKNYRVALECYKKAEQFFAGQQITPETIKIYKQLRLASQYTGNYNQAFAAQDQHDKLLNNYATEKETLAGIIDGRQVEQIINGYYLDKENKMQVSILIKLAKAAAILALLAFIGILGYHVKHQSKLKKIRSIIKV